MVMHSETAAKSIKLSMFTNIVSQITQQTQRGLIFDKKQWHSSKAQREQMAPGFDAKKMYDPEPTNQMEPIHLFD
jgi:hypothetical protein